MSLSLPEFVERWKATRLSERAAAQTHFNDLCEILGQSAPVAADQTGENFRFEKHVTTVSGGKGFADVWKRGHFAWEYKGKHKDLHEAYLQLLQYREDLENPPLLVVCDHDRFEVHTNFTGTAKHVYRFSLSDLLSDEPTPNCALPPLEVLRALFGDPEQLRPEKAAARVTERAAAGFAKLALNMEARGVHPERAAHFLMRLLFCLFGDSIGLLPDHLFRNMIEIDKGRPANFTRKLQQLFSAMATQGNTFGMYDISHFNGGLFADDEVFELDAADMSILHAAAKLDWANVEPAIFGTLFERSLDPSKRSELGAHYTSKEDILLIVDPVLMGPLRKRWLEVRAQAEALAEAVAQAKGPAYAKLRAQMQEKLFNWVEELSKVRILDPACGSGNFLYLALKRMLDLWKEVYVFAAQHGLRTILPYQVHPSQLYGIEMNVYAHELASVVVWIGYLQWLNDNGMGRPIEPILQKLTNIQQQDAILSNDSNDDFVEAEWPQADFIIGNPPFLGGKRLRAGLGDHYVDELYRVYTGRIPPDADLVTYWFEKARALVEKGEVRRVGLLATQGIRGGVNRTVLERIKRTGDIFWAESDRDWILAGANVHVSMVGFDDGSEAEKILNGKIVTQIHANLTSEVNTNLALRLAENLDLAFQGPVKVGKFELKDPEARQLLASPNPNGLSNSDVVKPWMNGADIKGRPRNMWIIDFGDMDYGEACLFEAPFELVKKRIQPKRSANRDKQRRENWWRLGRSGGDFKIAKQGKSRIIVTTRHSKHRIFLWASRELVPDSALIAIARDDDYFFGVLQSHIHELWARSQGTQVRDVATGFRYTPSTTFETFPFPWPPSQEPSHDSHFSAISTASRELVGLRDAWLNPPNVSPDELKKRTLTNLYTTCPAWLTEAHRELDEAVFGAYHWPSTLSDVEILGRLLALNHQRAE
jgi:type II restriction/modification system DNA methylase subunit YeeA